MNGQMGAEVSNATKDIQAIKSEKADVSGKGSYPKGARAKITAVIKPGYAFSHWIGEGVENPDQAETTILMDQHRKIKPVIERVWNVIARAEPEEGGTTEGSGQHAIGTNISLKATPAEGYTFVSWEGQDIEKPSEPEISIKVGTGPIDLVARFKSDKEDNSSEQQPEPKDQEQKDQDKSQQDSADEPQAQPQEPEQQPEESAEPEAQDEPESSADITKEEALQLLDGLKDQEKKLPASPESLHEGTLHKTQGRDW
jgi:hypothetical protein